MTLTTACATPPENMVERRDHTADADDRDHGANAHARQPAGESKADRQRHADVAHIKAVFGKAHALAHRIRDRLHDPIARIGHQPHVERRRRAHTGQRDGEAQKQQPSGQAARERACIRALQIRDPAGEQVEHARKDQAQRELERIKQQRRAQVDASGRREPFPLRSRAAAAVLEQVKRDLRYDEQRIERQRRIAEVKAPDGRYAERDRYDRRHAQPHLGVERQPERQHQQAEQVEQRADAQLFVHVHTLFRSNLCQSFPRRSSGMTVHRMVM